MKNCFQARTTPSLSERPPFKPAAPASSRLASICVYCGASDDVKPEYRRLAETLGHQLASNGIRLVYGGGGVGLMGACARAVYAAGGDVLGVMPRFLLEKECVYADVKHIIVNDMHTRKRLMFEHADAFIVLPGGIGTLEEAVEVLSWSRLDLHSKPVAFLDEDGFWTPFFDLMTHIIDGRFTPASFRSTFLHCSDPSSVIDALHARIASNDTGTL